MIHDDLPRRAFMLNNQSALARSYAEDWEVVDVMKPFEELDLKKLYAWFEGMALEQNDDFVIFDTVSRNKDRTTFFAMVGFRDSSKAALFKLAFS